MTSLIIFSDFIHSDNTSTTSTSIHHSKEIKNLRYFFFIFLLSLYIIIDCIILRHSLKISWIVLINYIIDQVTELISLPAPVALIRVMWIFRWPLISVWFHRLFFFWFVSFISQGTVLPVTKRFFHRVSGFLFILVSVHFYLCVHIFIPNCIARLQKLPFLSYICIHFFYFICQVTVVPVQVVFRVSRVPVHFRQYFTVSLEHTILFLITF